MADPTAPDDHGSRKAGASRKNGFWQPWIPLTVLVLLIAIANWRVFVESNTSFNVIFDLVRQYMPARWFAIDSLSHASVPGWNPYNATGVPFVASQYGAYYPPYFIRDLLMAVTGARPTPKVMSLFAVEEMALAGIGMLMLARSLGVAKVAAVIGGLAFGLSGFMVGHTGHPPIINGALWLPWAVWALVVLARRVTPLAICGLAGAMAMPLLAGHLPTAASVWFVLGAIAVALATGRGISRRSFRPSITFIAASAVGALLAAGLSGIHLIPELEFVSQSARTQGGFEFATSFSYPRRALPLLGAPHIFGAGSDAFTGPPFFWEYWGYTGMLALLLAPLALFRRRRAEVDGYEPSPRSTALVLGAMAVLAVLLMLGKFGPLYGPLFAISEQLGRIRVPARWVLVFDFSIALLAALGADALISHRRSTRPNTGSGSDSGSDSEATSRPGLPLWPALGAGLLIGGSIASVVIAWPSIFNGVDPEEISRRGAVLALSLLLASLGWIVGMRRATKPRFRRALGWGGVLLLTFDLAVSSTGFMLISTNRPIPDEAASRRAAELAWSDGLVTPTSVPLYRIETDSGALHDGTDAGFLWNQPRSNGEDSLVILKYHELRSEMGPSESPGAQFDLFTRPEVGLEVLDLLGAHYLITPRDGLPPELTTKYAHVGTYEGASLYRRNEPPPRAWITTRAVIAEDTSANAYAAARLDPLIWAVLSRPPPDPLPDGITSTLLPATPPSPTRNSSVTVEANDREYIRYAVNSDDGGILVASELYYPGWRAFIDGVETPVLEAQHALRGVQVPAGKHTVEYRFESASIRLGARLTAASLGIIVLLAALTMVIRRRRRIQLRSPDAHRSA